MKVAAQEEGRLVARALRGSWRREPSGTNLSEQELARVIPALVGSGASALAWRNVGRSPLKATKAALELQQAYRMQTLRAAMHERDVERLFTLLNSAGVDAVLIKGWAAERAYTEPGLRHAGDIDLCVRPEQYAAAKEILSSPEGRRFHVDLHEGFRDVLERDVEDIYARTEVLTLGRAFVRVLSAEDHLRLLCVHTLRHGAWRPLWLCDVAAAMEARGREFDWERLLGRDRRRANWVACALGLAEHLLGADVEGTPIASAANVPRWLVASVLMRWARPYAMEQPPFNHRAPMRTYLHSPRGLLGDLRNRWPGPVEATIAVGAKFNKLPRWPFQLANCAARAARFVSAGSA
ncbi:MAG: hypothetical protein QOE46_2765 [Acidobacteriota bacterium]|jgi:hypothetical protein|nr:hypothetical protein [Acidobacteriota bacterium]